MRLLHPLFALLACATRQELARQVAYLREENRILRARLPQNIRTTAQERRRLVRAGRRLGVKLRPLISIVCYDTFLKWARHVETQRSVPRKAGPQRTPQDVRDLVIRLKQENGWGYARILGELKKLGIELSRQTVKNILVEAGLTTGPDDGHDTWDAFLRRHAETLWQCDFVTKPMWTLKGLVDLHFLVCLHLGSRRVWISPCTAAPDSGWQCQQAREFLAETQLMQLPAGSVMRDNDAKYSAEFDAVLTGAGIQVKRNTPVAPNLRAHVERFIQSLKFELLDKFVIVGERHLDYICRVWSRHYNGARPHSSRNHLPPDYMSLPAECTIVRANDIVCTSQLGGVIHSYSRRAA